MLHHFGGIARVGTLRHGARVQNPRREILHLLRPLVFALQIQAQGHRVRARLGSAGRIRQNRRHGRRIARRGATATAAPARRISVETGLAAFLRVDCRCRDERARRRRHLLRRLLHVGRQLLFQSGRPLGLYLQRGGPHAGLPRRRPLRVARRPSGGQRGAAAQ